MEGEKFLLWISTCDLLSLFQSFSVFTMRMCDVMQSTRENHKIKNFFRCFTVFFSSITWRTEPSWAQRKVSGKNENNLIQFIIVWWNKKSLFGSRDLFTTQFFWVWWACKPEAERAWAVNHIFVCCRVTQPSCNW